MNPEEHYAKAENCISRVENGWDGLPLLDLAYAHLRAAEVGAGLRAREAETRTTEVRFPDGAVLLPPAEQTAEDRERIIRDYYESRYRHFRDEEHTGDNAHFLAVDAVWRHFAPEDAARPLDTPWGKELDAMIGVLVPALSSSSAKQ